MSRAHDRFVALGLALACLCALVAAPLSAQVKSVGELQYPPLPDFDVPEPTRVELDNGMVVLLVEDHELPLVDVIARVHTGSRLDPADKIGLARLTGDVLRTGGTEKMSAEELDRYLESRAASIETSIGDEFGTASMSVLAEDFAEVLPVFADVLRRPAFAEEPITVAVTAVEAEIARQNDSAQQIVFRELNSAVYGEDSPYAYEPTYATVQAIGRDDLVDWHAKYFRPGNVVLGLVGDFDTEQAVGLVKQAFGDWQKGSKRPAVDVPFRREANPGVFYVEKNDVTQANVALGHLGIRRDNPDYHAVEVMNQVMGGSFASRLFSRVRSEQGLAYTVFGQVGSDWDHEGVALMFTSTKTETTGAAIEALLREARNMVTEEITDQEVAKAKQSILSSFVFNFDSPRKILGQQLTYEYYGYPLDWISRYRKGIESVTPAQVRAAAAEYLHPDDFAIVVVGPSEGMDRDLADFGEVTKVDISIAAPAETRAEVTAAGRSAADEILTRAVEAVGGPAVVDGMESLSLTGTASQVTPQGEVEIPFESVLVFPDRLRQALTLPFGELTMALTGDGGFMIGPQGPMDLPDSQRQALRTQFLRTPMLLLRARGEDGFEATSLGSGEIAGATYQLVQVEYEGMLTTLGFDPESGRLTVLRYQGPGPTGAPGEVVQTLSDFREADGGLVYHHRSEATFDGEPMGGMTVETVGVGGAVDPALFEKPEM
jgi:zinc protease